MKKSELRKLIKEEIIREQMLTEIGVLGVTLGVLGALAIWKGTPALLHIVGGFAHEMADKARAKEAAKKAAQRHDKFLKIAKDIAKKFENDTKLQQMYQELTPIPTTKTGRTSIAKGTHELKKQRAKQLKEIASYIKSKLNNDEVQYFNIVSQYLRTGNIKL